MSAIFEIVAQRLNLPLKSIKATAELLEEGSTVPFIARYRKERTGSLDEVQIRDIEAALKTVRELEARKEFIREAIENAGAMTPQLSQRLDEAQTMTEAEDIYAPFKPKKRTRATMAREKGLEPLAKIIMAGRTADAKASAARFCGREGASDYEDALSGAADIIAEWASESTRLRNITRNAYRRSASIVTSVAKGKEQEIASSPLAQYAEFSQSVRRMPSHQYLGLRRAENEGLVKVKYSLDQALTGWTMHSAADSCRSVPTVNAPTSSRRLSPTPPSDFSAHPWRRKSPAN